MAVETIAPNQILRYQLEGRIQYLLHNIFQKLCGEEMVTDVAGREGEPAVWVPFLCSLECNFTVLNYLVDSIYFADNTYKKKRGISKCDY